MNVALLNPPVGVLLSGTLSAPDYRADGVATFANLAVNAPATGLRLRATATFPGVFRGGTSEPFDVGIPAPTNLFFITAADGDRQGCGDRAARNACACWTTPVR